MLPAVCSADVAPATGNVQPEGHCTAPVVVLMSVWLLCTLTAALQELWEDQIFMIGVF